MPAVEPVRASRGTDATPAGRAALVADVVDWFAEQGRDLPWRAADRTAWGVLVSEVMLQQTPVARVIPVWTEWMRRWPQPADLAAATPGDAVRAWGNLGYPRRAMRLHDCATVVVDLHGGSIPDTDERLMDLPGVGAYTAAAVRAFAHGQRSVVLDTNVRRVLARLLVGEPVARRSLTVAERTRAERVVPAQGADAARWSAAVMELGALVCTASSPRCAACPVEARCAWVRAGRPGPREPRRPAQRFAGTDRQARGRIMAVLRGSDGPVDRSAIDAAWDDAQQRDRALGTLLVDGLVEALDGQHFTLPGEGGEQPEGPSTAPTSGPVVIVARPAVKAVRTRSRGPRAAPGR